jgi:hypothetical protein
MNRQAAERLHIKIVGLGGTVIVLVLHRRGIAFLFALAIVFAIVATVTLIARFVFDRWLFPGSRTTKSE